MIYQWTDPDGDNEWREIEADSPESAAEVAMSKRIQQLEEDYRVSEDERVEVIVRDGTGRAWDYCKAPAISWSWRIVEEVRELHGADLEDYL